jgi:hypothetical protein
MIETGNAIKAPHMAQTHDHGDHSHPAAPMVEEISDFEILEIAVRELAIEKGLFTAEDPGNSPSGLNRSDRQAARASSRRRGPIRLSRRVS